MKKIAVLLLFMIICVAFVACSDNTDINDENATDIMEDTNSQITNSQKEDTSSAHKGSLSLEDVSAEYVEPTFKVVSTLAECYDYFDTESTDVVTTENNPDGTVSLITVADKNGNTKATMQFKYEDKTMAVASYYENDEVSEKVAFLFHNEDSVSIIAHVDSDSNMSLYFYNEDGTFNSYVDSAGFSSLITGTIMEGLGGALSQ